MKSVAQSSLSEARPSGRELYKIKPSLTVGLLTL
ncbi:MAG: hypothetical protein QOK48_3345 [Blastocatellia bacterium]|jgi:hypothetical protein|nr:hypothetical protein [Blastocatellia bacterium]